MNDSSTSVESAKTYIFRFDTPIEPRIFGDEYDISGWLLHSGGKPINGIRALVRRRFAYRKIFRARRKRDRPDVAAAFPHLPEAKASGFLLELRPGLGRNYITLQVLDHDRVWRTFYTATLWAFPLTVLKRLGVSNLHRFLISYLQQSYSARKTKLDRPLRGSASYSSTPLQEPISTKRVDLFATSKSNLFILEIGALIAAGFRELGCTAQMQLDQIPQQAPPPDTLQLIVTPHEYYNLFLTEKLSEERARDLTRNVVLLCTEQPETGWFHSNLQWAAHARGVADINPLGVSAYRARGAPSYHFHLGYHAMLASPTPRPHRERSYDVTFLGSMTARRDVFFAQHAPFFAKHRCHIRFVPLSFAKTKITRSYLSSERRNELLNQSRILLNVHYSERRYFEWHRILLGLANECCVISETSEGYGALVPGQHFIMADREDLLTCCDYYLNHPDECEAIARQGAEFVRTQLRQAQACETFLRELKASHRPKIDAAHLVVELSNPPISSDASPIPLPKELRRAIRRRRLRQLKHALADDLRNFVCEPTPLADAAPQPGMESSSKHRISAVEKREAYKARWTEQEATRATGEVVWKLYDNEAYNLSARPELSIVITLFNYEHYIQECVTSISRAAEKVRHGVEIVIVNDASTDHSLTQAIHCQSESSLPMRIVDKRFNTGLADARNVGVQIARAPYVFMMDADNLIFPEGFAELLDTIRRDNYAAAYSLICRFRGTTANRVGLLSYYDWDPQILVQHPYIDAMAMFRRDVLLELGGYDNQLSQVGWFGWEDYDMWLRFAQKDYPVGFVPNILCLYRHHETSMINLTNLFETELVHHLLERYGELVGHFEPRETLFGIERTKIAAAKGKSVRRDDPLVTIVTTAQ